jgi:Fic family protein
MLSFDSITVRPPYIINARILELLFQVGERIGAVNAGHLERPSPSLRRRNRIRTVQGTLAIEGNTLSEEQVTAILDGRRVLAKPSELQEVTNAIAVYEMLHRFNVYRISDLRKAHGSLMKDLIADAGRFRARGVGILRGSRLAHLAPPASMVPTQVQELLRYLKEDKDPMLLKSCVLHYELEFIHPFSDGNGRMGRLWQTRALMEVSPVFGFLPVEGLVRDAQADYYRALAESDAGGNCTPFVTYMLELIVEALKDLLEGPRPVLNSAGRMGRFLIDMGDRTFTRKDYLTAYPEVSTATASRDLREAMNNGWLRRRGDGRTSTYSITVKGRSNTRT